MPVEATSLGTAVLGVTLVLSLAVLAGHIWLSVTRGHRNLVLRAVPVALAPLTFPLPAAIWSIIASFNDIAKTGSSGFPVIAGILQRFLQVQWLGVSAAGAIVVIAAVAERLGATHIERAAPTSEPVRSHWRNWFLVGSLGLLVPAAALNMFAHHIAHVIVRIGEGLMSPDSAATRPDVSGVAQSLSSQIVLGLLSGVVASVAVLLGILGTFVASSAAPPPRLLVVAGWIMVALAIAAVIASVVSYGAEMRWLSALAKAYPR
jgi:hypothetical protein